MKFSLSEEQGMLQDSVHSFLSTAYGDLERRATMMLVEGSNESMWTRFADLGWLGVAFNQDVGGHQFGALEEGLLMRAFGQHLVVEPYHGCVLLASRLLSELEPDPSLQMLLSAAISGERRFALAHLEPMGKDPLQDLEEMATYATPHEGRWLVSGSKRLVWGGAATREWIVSARLPLGGIGLLLVDVSGHRERVRPVATQSEERAADLDLDAAPATLLAEGAAAVRGLRIAHARARVARGWEAVGTMEMALTATARYVRERTQFGRQLVQFQVVEHRLAEMAVACEEALAACEIAALVLDGGAGEPDRMESMSFLVGSKVGRCARYVAQQSVQLHGAMGVSEDLPIAAAFRRLSAFGATTGMAQASSGAYGRSALQSGLWTRSTALGGNEFPGRSRSQA